MKFLTSSASTASSTITTTTTTSTSFDSNSRSTPAGCISGVLRRLLCLKSLPTHPSDHDSVSVELDGQQCTNSSVKTEEKADSSAAMPSIVARLMGLESLPQIDFSATEKSPNAIARSRSMNSVDLMKELVSIQGRHRRVKSFRETVPKFLELEDEEFFILSFENVDGNRKSETGTNQLKKSDKGENCLSQKSSRRRESVYEKNKENQDPVDLLNDQKSRKVSQMANSDGKLNDSGDTVSPLGVNSSKSSLVGKEVENLPKPMNHKAERELGRRRRRKMKKRKDDRLPVEKVESDDSDSENSSPNSVLDIIKFPCDPEVTSSAPGISRLTNSKSRRTLSEELENYRRLNHQSIEKSSISSNNVAACKSRNCSEGKRVELMKNEGGRQNNCVDMWGEICKMAKKDVQNQSGWIPLNKEIHKFESCKEIGRELELQIFEELLGEIVDQLAGQGLPTKF